ncbi:MAG: hypothetical protein HC834_07905 [Rhodospirillales bacterium]|nr:hypothetical protein [Rhodospirillales bacterium]
MVKTLDDLKIDVVEVQQWLQDISATRGLDGLNDGFDEAAAAAARFAEHQIEAVKLSEQLSSVADMEEFNKNLAAVAAAFDPYYQVGQKMAHAYVDEGPAGGNRMMPEFDAAAERMTSSLEHLYEDTNSIKEN